MADKAKCVLLAEKWDDKTDPTGWWMSEKLDGVRAYWSGSAFYSRQGNMFHAPKFFTKDLPKTPLDGELWCGRGLFQKCVSIVKKKNNNVIEKDWEYITYLVFDAPMHGGVYEDRVKWLKDNINEEKNTTYATVVGTKKCDGVLHLNKTLAEVEKAGGEGLMLRKPKSAYDWRRSTTLLKVKTFHDEEARVLGHKPGTGRCASMMGGLECELPNGKQFTIGTGFDDNERKHPPKIGAVVTFKYQELSDSGHPRFPVYLRTRHDLTWNDVLENAKTHVPKSTVGKTIPKLLKKQHTILFSVVPSRDPNTGNKIVTSDDEDDNVKEEVKAAAPAPKGKKAAAKPMCKYGAACYRTNADHVKQFDHPPRPELEAAVAEEEEAAPAPVVVPIATGKGKKAGVTPTPSIGMGDFIPAYRDLAAQSGGDAPLAKIPCKFGASCYRKSPFHLQMYSHNAPQEEVTPLSLEEIKEFKGLDDDEGADDEMENNDILMDDRNAGKSVSIVDDEAMQLGDEEDDDEGEEMITKPKAEWDAMVARIAKLEKIVGALMDDDKPSLSTSQSALKKKRKEPLPDDDGTLPMESSKAPQAKKKKM